MLRASDRGQPSAPVRVDLRCDCMGKRWGS